MNSERRHFACHWTTAFAFYLMDVALNATIEYGDLTGGGDGEQTANTILTIAQVLLQVSSFIHFLSLLGATFLFRSGLFGILFKQFRLMLLVLPGYILHTIILGAVRLHYLGAGLSLTELWDLDGYHTISCTHKLGAMVYYFTSVRSIEKLHDGKFYHHNHWILR